MDFNAATPGSFLTAPFQQDGIQLTLLSGHYDLFACALPGLCPPANVVMAGLDRVLPLNAGLGPPSRVRISLVSGALFNLESMEVSSGDPLAIMQASSGPTLALGPSASGVLTGLTAFRGISHFDIESSVDIAGGFLFDNIVVTPVPEAGMVWPVALGLLIALRRRW